MFQGEVEQIAYVPSTLVVGMPVMTSTYEDAEAQLNALPYKTYGIGMPNIRYTKQHSQQHSQQPITPKPLTTNPIQKYNQYNMQNKVFKVKAELGADKYMLYTDDNKIFEQALVSSYKSSVLLNSLFRNIKENTNLDLLEESDDEDEFENTELDRFVDLEKTVVMECVYSNRFKKWEPVKVVSKN